MTKALILRRIIDYFREKVKGIKRKKQMERKLSGGTGRGEQKGRKGKATNWAPVRAYIWNW